MIGSVFKYITGIVKLRGATDGTQIGNVTDSLKTTVTASVLPTGAATSALQTTGNTSLASIDTKTPALVSGRQPVDGSGVTQPVSAVSLPLPTGAATLVEQQTQTTRLTSIRDAVEIMDDWDELDRAKVNLIVGSAGVQGASGAVSANTQRVVLATDVALPTGTNSIGQVTANAGTNLNTSALALETTQTTGNTRIGDLTETAPASDTASSGLNGRLQRIAQRLTSIIALLPTSLGQKTEANSFATVLASDQKFSFRGTFTDRSGTSTAASASKIPANASRNFLFVQNHSNQTMWINFGVAAVAAAPSIKIASNTEFILNGSFVTTQEMFAIRGGATDVAFTAKEG